MVRSHRMSVAMHVPVAQILTTERRFLLQNCGNPFERYLIVYRAVEYRIEIVRVLHSARDFPPLFE